MSKKKTHLRKTAKGAPRFKNPHTKINYAEKAYQFALEASQNKDNKFCGWVIKAAKRYLNDLNKTDWPFNYDQWHANNVCDFIEKLPHIEGEWETPTIRLEPPQIFILSAIFGFRRKDNGLRRITSVYIEMARKGAKSTLTAGVALYCLTCEEEIGPQIIIGATTGEQAGKVFNPAKAMAEKNSLLRSFFGIETWARSITCQKSGGFIQPINAKGKTQDGWNPHVGILDELHAHPNRQLFDVVKSAFGSRRNPLLWVISTAGYDTQGVCYEQRTLVTKILNGIVEADHYFGIIFTLDEDDDEYDPNVWIKANPMLGITPTLESMKSYALEAKESPDSAYEFKTKRLNVWTTAKGAWLNAERWKSCCGVFNENQLIEVPAYGGLDLASVSDISAWVIVWELNGRIKVRPKFYLPEETIEEHSRRRNVPYRRWVDEGLIIATPGNATDYNYIEHDIRNDLKTFNIRQIGFDPWNATQLVSNLLDDDAPMIEVRQGPKTFNPPMTELERILQAQTLDHCGNPVLAWMASNVVARRDVNDNKAPDKKNSHEKIDGIVAMLMAMGLLLIADDQDDYISGNLIAL